MALRKFKCSKCECEYSGLGKSDTVKPCPSCATENKPQLPTEISTAIYETRDKYRGAQIRKNQEQRMRKRMNEHHDKYEVADKIDKYGLDDAKRYGWLKRHKKL